MYLVEKNYCPLFYKTYRFVPNDLVCTCSYVDELNDVWTFSKNRQDIGKNISDFEILSASASKIFI